MSLQLPELPAPGADLDREADSAAQVVAERPQSWLGVPRKPGTPDDVYFANLTYYKTYPGAALKIAPGDTAGGEAWKRGRALVNKELLAQVPTSPTWRPDQPTWPLATAPRSWSAGSKYKARRPWKKTSTQTRYHTGTDLGAAAGIPILAPEAGIVVAAESGWEMVKGKDGKLRGVKSLIMVTDSGRTVLLGGTRPGSARVKTGDRVAAGQQVAEVGEYPLGDSMLHFQLYGRPLTEAEVNKRKSWAVDTAPPADLVDPSDYLQAASTNPIKGFVGLVGDQQPDEGALVANDVEGGEQTEGTPAGNPTTGGNIGLMIAVGAGVLTVASVGLWLSSRPTPRKNRRRAA